MRRSRTCSAENCNAVCETTGARGAGAGAWVAGATGLSNGEAVAGGVLQASDVAGARRCRRDCRVDGRRRRARSLGVLEVFRSTAAPGSPLESHTRASGVLRAAVESAAADEAPSPAALAPAARGTAATESDLGARLHGRRPVRPASFSRPDDDRMREGSWRCGDDASDSRRHNSPRRLGRPAKPLSISGNLESPRPRRSFGNVLNG
jgi:hypothetical protein